MSNGCLLHADRHSLNTQSYIKGFWWYVQNSAFWTGWAARPVLKISTFLLKQATFESVFFSNVIGEKNIFNFFGILKSKCTTEGSL